MAVAEARMFREWQRVQADQGGEDAQAGVLDCRDTLELLIQSAFPGLQQAAVVKLFLVSKSWGEAARSLELWRSLEWEQACKGARRSDEALPALRRSIERWWGSRLTDLDAGNGCPTFRELLTDDTLALIARSAPHLQSVRLWGCMRITDNGLKRLAAAAPPLCSFSLAWCGQGVCLDGLRAVVHACPYLESFSVSCGQESVSLGSVGDAFVAELATACPHIRSLELSDTSITDAGLASLAAAFGPQLTHLVINYTRRWGGRGGAALAAACPRLQAFSAVGAPGLADDTLAALGAGCPHLAFVRVDRCPRVSLDGVIRLVNRSTNGEGGGTLRAVEMAGVFRQSAPEQRAFFSQWVAARGLRYDARRGLLSTS